MASTVANDGTLIRGTEKWTIGSVSYIFVSFDDDGAAARSEYDYDESGKPYASSHAEDFQKVTGVIRARSDQVAPVKFTLFSRAYDGKNYQLINRRYTGSTEGLKEYAVEAVEVMNGSITTS